MLTLWHAANVAATVHHADAIPEVQADELLSHFRPALHRFCFACCRFGCPLLWRFAGFNNGFFLSLKLYVCGLLAHPDQ